MGEAGRREKDEGGDAETWGKEIRVNKFCSAANRASAGKQCSDGIPSRVI